MIGRNTVASMQSGLVFGYAGLVDAIVERIRGEIDFSPRVVGTGGLAPLIAREARTIDECDDMLTLAGAGDPVRPEPPGRAMTDAPSTVVVRGFPARIGQLVVAPRAGVARVEAEGGGLRDALWLVVLGVVTFRLPELCRVLFAIAGPASGDLVRLVGLFLDETRSGRLGRPCRRR